MRGICNIDASLRISLVTGRVAGAYLALTYSRLGVSDR